MSGRPPVLRDVHAQTPTKLLTRPQRALMPPAHGHPVRQAPARNDIPPTVIVAGPGVEHQQGYEAGLREGLKDAEGQFEQRLQATVKKLEAQAAAHSEQAARDQAARLARLDQLLGGIEKAVSMRLDQLEPEAVALAYESICKLIGRRAFEPEIVAETVRHAITQLRGGTLLSVRLHPLDLEALASHAEGRDLLERHPSVQWTADPQSTRGGCTLQSDQGTVDATLLTQLARLREAWLAEGRS